MGQETPMLRSTIPTVAMFALVLALTTTGCDADSGEPGTELRSDTADLRGAAYTVALDTHPAPDVLEGIGREIEAMAQGVERAEIKVVRHGDGAVVEVRLVGTSLPGADFGEALRAKIPELADAAFGRSDFEPGAQVGPVTVEVDHGEDPAAVEEKIRAQLAADGVEGDVDVTVSDGPDGQREVEVRVEKREAP
jgi:hypothetical protein